MIKFLNNNNETPYKKFRTFYKEASQLKQQDIEIINIASYSKQKDEVDSRLVNLKLLDNNNFIFFSNYNSPKSIQFSSHDQISAVMFWNSINVQVRMKAYIKKTSKNYSDAYFSKRSPEKNALAISSNQSEEIDSYKMVTNNFNLALSNQSLSTRPNYWGGYKFSPFYFEFWKGHKYRINYREAFLLKNNKWKNFILQP